jgi:hypothetical protein
MRCNGRRKVLVQAMLHPYISIDSSYTCVFGGVGTKPHIKHCNDFFLACVEMTAGPTTPPSILSSPSSFYWGCIVTNLLLCILFIKYF